MSTTPALTSGTPQINSLSKVADNKSTLDKDGFLKMFVAQMQNQDPNNAQDPNESTQQMTQFSMLEQITNLVSQEQAVSQQLNQSSAVSLIGRTVTYQDAGGATQTGLVQKVATSASGATTLTVGDQTGVDPKSITEVA
jgi:flagellar basal-body rod modification protein FlgD